MKRLLMTVLALILLLTSCKAKSDDETKGTVTISLWHYYHGVQQTALDNLIKEFNTTEGLEKGIVVEAFSYGGVNELSESIFSSAREEAGSSPLPNIFSSYSDSAYDLKKMGKLADIEQYFTKEELDAYINDYLDEGRITDDTLSVFPVAKATEILMLNKTDWDIFEDAVNQSTDYSNVSIDMLSTWEGILEIAEIYYQWTDDMTPDLVNDGAAFFGLDSSANYFYMAVKQLGFEMVDGVEEKLMINESIIRKVWDTFYVPMIKGYFASYGRFRSDDVKTGDLLCFVGSTSSAAYFPLQVNKENGENYDIEAYVAPYPVFNEAEPVAVQQGAGMCIAKSDETHEKAAAEFIKWFTDPKRNVDFAINSAGYFPVTTKGMDILSDSETITKLKESGNRADENLAYVIEESIKQINEYKLYSSPVFSGTAELRAMFDNVKPDAAARRLDLIKAVSEGSNYEEELNKYISDDIFDNWLSTIK